MSDIDPVALSTAAPRPAAARVDPRALVLGLALFAIGLVVLTLQLTDNYDLSLVTSLAQSAVYALVVWLVTTRRVSVPLWFILAVAVAMRIGPLLAGPYLSTDIYRYVWDGRVQGAGINPYLYIPNNPALAYLRDDLIWPLINRADYAPTIYPPAAEMIFFLVTRISGSVIWMKTALVLCEGLTIWAIIRMLDAEGLSRERVLIYAWCPLCVWEFAGSGHIDAAMTAWVALALLATRRDARFAAGGLLGLAVLTKLFPILLFPALWRRWDWRMPVALAATILVGYLVYIRAGWSVFGFLPGYVGEEGISDGSGLWLLDAVGDATDLDIPTFAYVVPAVFAMGVLALWVVFRLPDRRRLYVGSLLIALASVLGLSPNYPWYFIWLLPMVCLVPSAWPVFWLICTGSFLYWSDWEGIFFTPNIVYGGTSVMILVALAYRLMQRRRLVRRSS